MSFRVALALAAATSLFAFTNLSSASSPDTVDQVRSIALPCEAVSTQGGISRAAKGIVHLANVCGFVGTDVELQSRKDAAGKVHDYAFVGTMGAGPRIFDVTDPVHPSAAGGYLDSGWENDVQVRGNTMVATFDGVNGEDSNASTCLKTRYPDASGQGVDIYTLELQRTDREVRRRSRHVHREPARRRAQRDAQPGRHVARHLELLLGLGDRRRRPARRRRRSATA